MSVSWQEGTTRPHPTQTPTARSRRRLRCTSKGGKQRTRLSAAARRLQLEALEDRTLLTTSISGNVFNDLNHNGLHDSNEPGLAGTTAFLDQNHLGVFGGS